MEKCSLCWDKFVTVALGNGLIQVLDVTGGGGSGGSYLVGLGGVGGQRSWDVMLTTALSCHKQFCLRAGHGEGCCCASDLFCLLVEICIVFLSSKTIFVGFI